MKAIVIVENTRCVTASKHTWMIQGISGLERIRVLQGNKRCIYKFSVTSTATLNSLMKIMMGQKLATQLPTAVTASVRT